MTGVRGVVAIRSLYSLVGYVKFYFENLRKTNLKMARFHWSRNSRDSCPTSSGQMVILKNFGVRVLGSVVRSIVNRGEGLEGGGVSDIMLQFWSRDNTSASIDHCVIEFYSRKAVATYEKAF